MRDQKVFKQALAKAWPCARQGVRRGGAWGHILAGLLSGCAVGPGLALLQPLVTPDLVVSAAFGPDGRLWRLRPMADTLYVESSSDLGRTFSEPVAVNRSPQRFKAVAEDRPQLAVDRLGRIYVVYYAEGPYPVTTYFSYSTDGGGHFSAPVVLSRGEPAVEHSMAMLAPDPKDGVHLFWYEDRPGGEPGTSLYHVSADRPERLAAPSQRVQEGLCECCRLAVDFDPDGRPVTLARFIFPGSVRDHGLLRLGPDGKSWSAVRATDDEWQINACPLHGPALSIAHDGRYHIAWFTQGTKRQGLFYAYSDDGGKHFSSPTAFGTHEFLAQHPDVLALGERVVLVWKEFDGDKTRLMTMRSRDRGNHWSPAAVLAKSNSESDHPFLISDDKAIFLSWNTLDHGYRLIPIE